MKLYIVQSSSPNGLYYYGFMQIHDLGVSALFINDNVLDVEGCYCNNIDPTTFSALRTYKKAGPTEIEL